MKQRKDVIGVRRAIAGASVALLVALLSVIMVGRLSGLEARELLQSVLPSLRFLLSSVTAAAATIVALMLTLLSVSYNTRTRLRSIHYRRIRDIALVDTITLVASVLLLLFISIPLQESDRIPPSWYVIIYYAVLLPSTMVGGMLVAVVLMLYSAIRDLIEVIEPDGKSDLIIHSEEAESDNEWS